MRECLAAVHEWILDDVFYGGQVVTFEHGVELCAPRGAETLDADIFNVCMTQLDEKGSDFSFTPKDPETPLPKRVLRLRLPHCVPVEELHELVFTHRPDHCDDAQKELLLGGTFAFSGYADHIVYDFCSYALMFAAEYGNFTEAEDKRGQKFLTNGPRKRFVRATLINQCTNTTWEIAAVNTPPGRQEEEATARRRWTAGIGAATHAIFGLLSFRSDRADRNRREFGIGVPTRFGLRPLQTVRFVSDTAQQCDDLFVSVMASLRLHPWSPTERKFLRQNEKLLKGDELHFSDEDLNGLLPVA
mmetsp:Transcript_25966/g.50402  ORF Transcript_25966/g.50402 Transcript_25966/m.50402 type:complete len:302 (+) Transcript_25966:2-907(+)